MRFFNNKNDTLNGDYLTKKEIVLWVYRQVNQNELISPHPLEAGDLIKSYKKGEIKDGKLKEIASKLDEDDNPVIMVIKHKQRIENIEDGSSSKN